MTQHQKTERLLALHQGPAPLLLPNAWDAGSAMAVQQAGYTAVASSSAAVAFANGYADGEQMPVHEMLQVVRRMAQSTDLPLTADFEGGYADDIPQLQQHITQFIATGAVGLNIEDSTGGQLRSIDTQRARLQAVHAVGQRSGLPLVLNARLDAFLLGHQHQDITEVAARANAYRAAGAACIFVPGVVDIDWWQAFLALSPGPANVMLTQDIPFAQFAALGVVRISMAAMPYRYVLKQWLTALQTTRSSGSLQPLTDALPYSDIKHWLKPQ